LAFAFIASVLLLATGAGGVQIAGSLVERGQGQLRRGDISGACVTFQAAADADPQSARAPYLLGLALARNGAEPPSIERAYRSAVARDPGFAPAHAELGRLLFGLRHTVEAQEQLEAALAIAPDLAEAHFELGLLFLQQNQQTDALVELSRAARLAPRDARFRAQLGDAYWHAGKLAEAAAELRRANELRPGNASQWSHLGLVLLAQKDELNARKCLETAIRLDPTTYPALLALAGLELSHGRSAAAIPLLDKARQYAPPDSAVAAMLCSAFATTKDRPDWNVRALNECRAAARTYLEAPDVQLHLLEVLVAQRDCAGAHAQLAVLEAIPLPPRESSWVQRGREALATCTAAPPARVATASRTQPAKP